MTTSSNEHDDETTAKIKRQRVRSSSTSSAMGMAHAVREALVPREAIPRFHDAFVNLVLSELFPARAPWVPAARRPDSASSATPATSSTCVVEPPREETKRNLPPLPLRYSSPNAYMSAFHAMCMEECRATVEQDIVDMTSGETRRKLSHPCEIRVPAAASASSGARGRAPSPLSFGLDEKAWDEEEDDEDDRTPPTLIVLKFDVTGPPPTSSGRSPAAIVPLANVTRGDTVFIVLSSCLSLDLRNAQAPVIIPGIVTRVVVPPPPPPPPPPPQSAVPSRPSNNRTSGGGENNNVSIHNGPRRIGYLTVHIPAAHFERYFVISPANAKSPPPLDDTSLPRFHRGNNLNNDIPPPPPLAHASVVYLAENMVTNLREFEGISAIVREPKRPKKHPTKSIAVKPAAMRAANNNSELLSQLMRGGGDLEPSQEELSRELPPVRTTSSEAFQSLNLPGLTEQYRREFHNRYNPSQLNAIASGADGSKPGFTLIQGPPGTGKTFTLFGLLNTLHLTVAQQCYDEILPSPHYNPNSGGAVVTGDETDEQQGEEEQLIVDLLSDRGNPHLLVVAPSNAAIDNVLRMIKERGFVDGRLGRYDPIAVRVAGASSTTNADVISLERQVDEWIASRRDRQKLEVELAKYRQMLVGVKAEIVRLHERVVAAAKAHAALEAEAQKSSNPDGLLHSERARELMRAFHDNAGQFISYRNRGRELCINIERMVLLLSSCEVGQLRTRLRSLSLLRATLVFATLSQCGSPSVRDVSPSIVRFRVVVVDEAAQAVEPSTLIPLSLGATRCVLVGDPNQLPATVFSDPAARAGYQRSLFERLQRCGHPVHLLNTQYRCRPEISSFVSRAFYGGALKDDASVCAPDEVRFPHGAMRVLYDLRQLYFAPIVFLDVAYGAQVATLGSSSIRNDAEAEVCWGLYEKLCGLEWPPHEPFRPKVGVIAAYRDQVNALHERFRRGFASWAAELQQRRLAFDINTVDAFQGQERDIIIFSCVRGGVYDEGIGFLNDARRLNVSLTRARHCLILVGQSKVLSKARMWRDLLTHIGKMGRYLTLTGEDSFISRARESQLRQHQFSHHPPVKYLLDG